jgi:four helix bundle protein
MKDFRDLNVWKKAHGLALEVYKSTANFPKEEVYGITSQLRRAALSIPTNIAEGCGRFTDADFAKFLQIAFGSASELEYLIIFSKELNYIDQGIYNKLVSDVIEIKKMLTSFLQKLRSDSK